MDYVIETMGNLIHQTAFFNLTWGNYVMILVACFFIYLAIGRGYEPLLDVYKRQHMLRTFHEYVQQVRKSALQDEKQMCIRDRLYSVPQRPFTVHRPLFRLQKNARRAYVPILTAGRNPCWNRF